MDSIPEPSAGVDGDLKTVPLSHRPQPIIFYDYRDGYSIDYRGLRHGGRWGPRRPQPVPYVP